MREDLFAFDYGVLSTRTPELVLTNITELLRNGSTDALLRMCGEEITPALSDYEWFCALCRALPLSEGHPVRQRVREILEHLFSYHEALCPSCCDSAWHIFAEHLLLHPMTWADCIRTLFAGTTPRCCISAQDLELLPADLCPVLDGDSLLKTNEQTWHGWCQSMEAILQRFVLRGCNTVVMTLPRELCDLRPDLYHLELALQEKLSAQERRAYCTAQLFRFLIKYCAEHGITLLLDIFADPVCVESLLLRETKVPCVPQIVWMTDRPDVRDIMLTQAGEMGNLRWALKLSSYPCRQERELALVSYAARAPIGKLLAVTGGDLLYCTEAQKDLTLLF